jgi:hypothetical protein
MVNLVSRFFVCLDRASNFADCILECMTGDGTADAYDMFKAPSIVCCWMTSVTKS